MIIQTSCNSSISIILDPLQAIVPFISPPLSFCFLLIVILFFYIYYYSFPSNFFPSSHFILPIIDPEVEMNWTFKREINFVDKRPAIAFIILMNPYTGLIRERDQCRLAGKILLSLFTCLCLSLSLSGYWIEIILYSNGFEKILIVLVENGRSVENIIAIKKKKKTYKWKSASY